MLTRAFVTAAATLAIVTPALAQAPAPDLKQVPASRRVVAVTYCDGEYRVTSEDGTARTFREYDLAFKVDSSAQGPAAGTAALAPSGRVGDRVFVVFATLEAMKNGPRQAPDCGSVPARKP